jgi:hypothetical protein
VCHHTADKVGVLHPRLASAYSFKVEVKLWPGTSQK